MCLSLLLAALAFPTIFYESGRLGEVRCATQFSDFHCFNHSTTRFTETISDNKKEK